MDDALGHESLSPLESMPSSSSAAGRTEVLCARFEGAWRTADQSGTRPRLLDYLATAAAEDRGTVLHALLALELRLRQELGELPTLTDYDSLFPDATELIRSVFEEAGFLNRGTTSANSSKGSQSKSAWRPRPDTTVNYLPPSEPAPEFERAGTPLTMEWPPAGASTEGRVSAEHKFAEEQAVAPRADGPAPGLPEIAGYEVLAELGKGGMGIVYKARHLQLQRLVALKMILPGHALSPRMVESFLVEAATVARFQHPHLVQIFDIGKHNGQPFLSLELLEGGNLTQSLAGTPQPPAEAAALLETLARTVDYAHQKGVVHRDLKPSNILLSAEGVPKIADFGLAKHLDEDRNQAQDKKIVGTPSYMAPEQAWGKNEQVGPAADIYALGVILYEMLTGRPPFKGADKRQTIKLVRTQEPVPPRQLVPQTPRDLELICLKCLKKDPRERFSSARELADELRRFQEGRPIRTRPTPFWEQAWKWARRQPAAASLVVVSVAALLSLVLFLDQRARVARRELREQQRTSDMRNQVQTLHLKARDAADKAQLQDAQGYLRAAFEIIQAEPSLAKLAPPLAALREEVKHRETEQKGQQEAAAGYREFFRLRDVALFHGMVFTGVDLHTNMAAAKTACQDALAIYGVTVSPSAGPVFPKYLSAQQRRQCVAACYEMLLVWAETERQSAPGTQAATQAQLQRALQILDRAAELDLPPTVAYHLRRASCLEQKGDAEAARKARQLAAATQPKEALDHFLTADAYQRQGKLAEAAKEFTQALRVQPDHLWARYFLAMCNLRLGRPAQARDNLTACLTAKSDFLWLYLFRGFANGQLDDFRAAEADFELALTLQPDVQALYGIRVYQGVLGIRQAKLAGDLVPLPWLFPLAPNLEFACRGVAGFQRVEKLTAASCFLEQAVALQPDHYPAYRYLALIAQELKRPDEAVKLLDRAIDAARKSEAAVRAQLFGQRARLHRERLDLDAALSDFGFALALLPSAEDHAERGRILFARQKHKEALADYEAALRLRPTDAEVYRWKADALLALKRDAEAASALDQYLATGGRPSAEMYRIRGQIRARLRQFPAAIADYTQALSLQPHSATYTARGWLFLANDVRRLALQDFDEAIRLDPKNGEAYAGRGLIRAWLGQYQKALADADAALLHGPQTSRLYWNSSHVYCQILASIAAHPGEYPTQTAAYLKEVCGEKALMSLIKALEQVPAAQRATFWQQFIASDELLNPIRETPGFKLLEGKVRSQR